MEKVWKKPTELSGEIKKDFVKNIDYVYEIFKVIR